jgi:DNA invertase Pin-like site-specific DNA recombinase
LRDTLNLVHDLKERDLGLRTLAGPLPIETSNPDSPMAQLAVVMLALFERDGADLPGRRASHARAVVPPNGRRTGWLPWSTPTSSNAAPALLRDKGLSTKEITAKTGLKT